MTIFDLAITQHEGIDLFKWIVGGALGVFFWLMVHFGNEAAKIKTKINGHAELHVEHRESLKRVEQKIDFVATQVSDMRSDIKEAMRANK